LVRLLLASQQASKILNSTRNPAPLEVRRPLFLESKAIYLQIFIASPIAIKFKFDFGHLQSSARVKCNFFMLVNEQITKTAR